LSPRQFGHLHKRWKQEQDREYYRTGLIASVVANFSMAPPKEPVKATDFIPGYKEPELTDEQVLDRLYMTLAPVAIPVAPKPKDG
jgi:hypothetical protein